VRQKYEKEEIHFPAIHFFASSSLAVILHPVRSVNLANPIQKGHGKNMCGKNMKKKQSIFLPYIFLSVLFRWRTTGPKANLLPTPNPQTPRNN
jgi:hypothetical protein